MIDLSHFDEKIDVLLEHRKLYETEFVGNDAVLKNRIRLEYFNNVSEKISFLKMERDMLEQSSSSVELAAMFCLFNGHASLPGRDGDMHHVSMKKTVYSRYEDIIDLNLQIVRETGMMVTDYVQFLIKEENSFKTMIHTDWSIRGSSPISSLEQLDLSIIKREFMKISEKKKMKYFYKVVPIYVINDNSWNNIFHEYKFIAKMC